MPTPQDWADLREDKIGNANYEFYLVFGRLPAELGPETRSNGPGSKSVRMHPQ